ncbi:type II methionyl aminopeptidase [Candidatus Pacearchaeota archaeon]|nr:type II methionyl aminopeptidase [Candidatus Pacearchaeota archaeon]
MTEKNYGGANSFGFKGSANKSNSEASLTAKPKKEKVEVQKSDISSEIVDAYLKAGKITAEVREYVKKFIKRGMPLIEIAEKIESRVEELGGKSAFPVNLSIDEIAAHYTPTLKDELKAEGLLKVDFGVEVEGYIADNAISFDFSDDGRYSEMIKFNQELLSKAIDSVNLGDPIKSIGNTIAAEIEKNGKYKIIRNLSGHSLEKDEIHAGLTVSNLINENNFELKDIAIAVEPFLTQGKGEIYEGKPSEIYMLQEPKLTRDRDARKVLEFIQATYRTKPFCRRWLEKAGFLKLNFILPILIREGIIYNFPVLIEKDKKPVSQAEHTLLFADKKYVTTKN